MKDNSKKESNISEQVIVGIIVAISCDFILRLFHNIPQIGKSLYTTIQNWIYSSAAQTSSNSVMLLIFEIIIFVATTLVLLPVVQRITLYFSKKKLDKYKDRVEDINSTLDSYQNKETSTIDIDALSKELKMIENDINRSDKPTKKWLLLDFLTIVLILFYFVFVALTVFIPMVLLDKFMFDIQLIKPYTDTETIMIIESDWTRMKNKTDYDIIYTVIDEIKEDNDLT